MACGLQETFGTHAKPLNVGHACQSGVQAGWLAMEGFTGPEDILSGPKGFVAATTEQFNPLPLQQINQGQFSSTTAFYKVYASCGHTNSALDAVFMLMGQQEIPVSSIKAVRVSTYRTAVQLTGAFKNQSEEEAKFSLPYCVAAALLYKRVTLAEFASGTRKDSSVVELAQKIHVSEDVEATKVFPRERRAEVTLEMHDGRVLREKIFFPHDVPADNTVEDKFLSLSRMTLDSQEARMLKDMILDLEHCPNLDGIMAAVR
jgi:2-methylcitrate dehydratase PrpD